MKKIEITEDILRGLYLILSGLTYSHKKAKAIPIMDKAHKEIIKLGHDMNFDNRGSDL